MTSLAPLSSRTAPAPLPTQVATVGGGFLKRSEPLFLGADAAGQGFGSVGDAMGAAAALSRDEGGGVFAVVAGGGGAAAGQYQLKNVLQPVWEKGWSRDNALHLERATLEPLGAKEGGRSPKFGFVTKTIDKYGSREERTHSGRLHMDPSNAAMTGLHALVGPDWGYLVGDDRLVDVAANRPPAPPQPPVDPPVDPPHPPAGNKTLVEDVTEAVRLAAESARIIRTVPESDIGAEETKATRIKAYKTNLAAQDRLEKQFSAPGQAESIVSILRRSDASLEDANWQLAKKPSPDGRFNGVDVPGALRDTQTAVDLLNGLLGDITTVNAA